MCPQIGVKNWLCHSLSLAQLAQTQAVSVSVMAARCEKACMHVPLVLIVNLFFNKAMKHACRPILHRPGCSSPSCAQALAASMHVLLVAIIAAEMVVCF